jgi:flagellin-like protein
VKFWKEVRGISPLIATLILVAATVAGGAIVYGVMRSQMSSLTGGADLEITYADVIVAGNAQKAFVTVKNTGSTNLSGVTVTITTENNGSYTPSPISLDNINSGMQKTGEASGTNAWLVGKNYIVTVKDADNTVVKSLSVVAHA